MSVLTRDFVSGNYSSWQVLIGVLHLALVNLLTLARCGFYCRNTDKIGRAAKQEWSNPLVKLTGRPLSGKSDKEVRTPTVYYPSRHLQRWIRLKLAVCYKLNQVWQVYKSCRIRHGQTKFQSRTVWLMRTHQVGKHATCGGKWPQNTKTERDVAYLLQGFLSKCRVCYTLIACWPHLLRSKCHQSFCCKYPPRSESIQHCMQVKH